MLATGLFASTVSACSENSEGEKYADYTVLDAAYPPAAVGDADDKKLDDLKCLFKARYVFPYYDEDGKVAFFIGRQPDFDTETGRHPDDFTSGKYAKLAKTKPWAIIDEPIYGLETVQDGQPLAITEGIADAITAHAHGIPCISPVTTQFKMSHREVLADIITDREIPDVYFLQDSDPPKRIILDEADQDHDERRCARDMAIRELFCTGEFPGSDTFTQGVVLSAARDDSLDAKLDQEGLTVAPPADPEKDWDEETPITADEVPLHLLESDGEFRGTGPIGEVIDIHQYGQGIESAVKMGEVLDHQTPSTGETQTGTMTNAADMYREHVIEGDRDSLSLSDADTKAELDERLTNITLETETDTDRDDESEETQATLDGHADDPLEEYPGTDVWLIELPQFADEKRDLDDYLQEGWLGLIPPADWAQRVTLGEPPRNSDHDDKSDTQPVPAWLQRLAERDDPLSEYPTGMDIESLEWPVVDDITRAVGRTTDEDKREAAFHMYDPFVIPDEKLDTAALQAAHSPPVKTGKAFGVDDVIRPGPYNNAVYPPLSLFGALPTLHPSQHPEADSGATTALGGTSSGTDLDVDPQAVKERAENTDDYRALTGRNNPLWALDLRDLGLSKHDRGKNPLGHYGESENYFVVHDHDLAYCHKRKVAYNFQHFALCDMGVRDPDDPLAGNTLDDLEYFQLWVYARENNLVPDHTPIPMKGLVGFALDRGICSRDELEPFETDDDDSDEESDETKASETDSTAGSKRNLKIPAAKFGDVMRQIKEETGNTPPRGADSSGSQEDAGAVADGQSESNEDIMEFDEAAARFGEAAMFMDIDELPSHPIKLFLKQFVEYEDGEVTTDRDETKHIRKTSLHEAYCAWVQINRRKIEQISGKSIEDYNLKEYDSGNFARIMQNKIDSEIKDAKHRIDGERISFWYGIELIDDAEPLISLKNTFTE